MSVQIDSTIIGALNGTKIVSGIRCDEAEDLFAKAGPVGRLRSAEPLKMAAG